MKRKIGVVFLITAVLVLQACNKDEYVLDTHKRDDIVSKQFDMIRCEKEYGTVCVETTDEALAQDIVRNIDDAIENIELESEEEEKQTIYVMNSVPALTVNAVGENIIFADYEKVMAGDTAYIVQELLYRYYDCDYWISYGLSHINDEIDTEELSRYYGNSDNRIQLQLYGNHFFETFQDAEECRIEKNTAVSVIQNICSSGEKITKDIANDIENNKEEYINSWLTSMGLSGDFEVNPELTEEHLTFYSSEEELFYVVLANIVIHIDGSPYNESCVHDLMELDEYFSYTQQDILDLNAFVESNDILGELVDCSRKIVCHKYEGSGAVNYTAASTREIELITWDSLPHEVVHAYLSVFGEHGYPGIEDGIAEYLGTVKFNGCRKRIACEYYLSGWDYFEKERNAYENIKPIDEEDFDMELFYHLWAQSCYNGEKDRKQSGQSISDAYAVVGLDVGRIEEFGDMTYMECEDYVAYIVNHYGFDEALRLLSTDDTNREENEKLIRQYLEEWGASLTD